MSTSRKKVSEVTHKTRRLAISLLVLLFVVYTFLVLASAWFSQSKILSASNLTLGISGVTDLGFDLYEYDYYVDNPVWSKVTVINLSNAVPNETRRYKVILTDESELCSKVNIEFTGISGTQVNENIPLSDLYKYIYIKSVDVSGLPVGSNDYDDPLSYTTIGTSGNSPYSLYSSNVQNTEILTISYDTPMNIVYFDIYVDKDICNCFSNWSFGEGKITVQK